MSVYKYDIIETPLGDLIVVFTEKGICRIGIRQNITDYLSRFIAKINPRSQKYTGTPPVRGSINRGALHPQWIGGLKTYFRGEPVYFHIPLDLQEGTPFRKKVWEVLRIIPYGEIRSYRWVAGQMGNIGACRAVGQANAANPVPIIIPCHRIIRTDGSLGGFSCGINIKKELLRLEGIRSLFSPNLTKTAYRNPL